MGHHRFSRYSDPLLAVRSAFRSPVEARDSIDCTVCRPEPGRSKGFYLLHAPADRPWGPSDILRNENRGSFQGVKRPGTGVNYTFHLAPRNAYSYTYLYSSSVLACHVKGSNLHLHSQIEVWRNGSTHSRVRNLDEEDRFTF